MGLALAFAAVLVALGVPYWSAPYGRVSHPGMLYAPGLVVLFAAALFARTRGRAGFLLATVVPGTAVPVLVMARVLVDTAADPTTHNLWPFEVVLTGVVAYAVAAAGALAGTVWSKLRRARHSRRRPS